MKMKAVQKFKSALERKRPAAFAATLGKGVRILHSLPDGDTAFEPGLQRSRSVDVDDRRNVEQALTIEGVHHDSERATLGFHGPTRLNSSVTMMDIPLQASQDKAHHDYHRHKLHADQAPQIQPSELHSETSGEKGHAHDPLDEQPLFLGIGSGGDDSLEPPTDALVAESPTAAEFSIYDTAYQEEVERIRSAQGHSTTIYLTRRVDSKKEYKTDKNMIDAPIQSEIEGGPHKGFKELLDRAREQQNISESKDALARSGQAFSKIAAKALENTKTMGKDVGDRSGAVLDNVI